MQETLVQFLGWEDPLEKGRATHSSILAWRIPELDTTERLSLSLSRPSLLAELVKNLSAVQETRVRSVDWEDPLEKGRATHSSILAWRIPWTV